MARSFLSPWLTFRQAREALRDGQPCEARRLVLPYVEQGYRKAIRLTQEVASAYLDRGEKSLRADNLNAAWADLIAAEALHPGDARASQLRATLTRDGVNEVGAALEAGNPVHALRAVAELRGRGACSPQLTQFEEAAQGWLAAADLANRGDFAGAKPALASARSRVEGLRARGVEQYARELERREERYTKAMPTLTASAANEDWRRVVESADEILLAAPEHREVRALRARAWDGLQPNSRPAVAAAVPMLLAAVAGAASGARPSWHRATSAYTGARPAAARPGSSGEFVLPPGAPLPTQFLLWVDGVGGYLVCLSPRVSIGQATADTLADLPLYAPIAGLHAEIVRDAEGGYVLESARETAVNGVTSPKALLRPGDRVTLGASCQFVFHRPTPLSTTGRVEIVSGHRMPWAVDGVILMDQTLILGTAEQVHIALPPGGADDDGAPTRLILHRTPVGLALKCPGKFRVDNRPCADKADLPLPASVQTERFTFTLEPIGPRV